LTVATAAAIAAVAASVVAAIVVRLFLDATNALEPVLNGSEAVGLASLIAYAGGGGREGGDCAMGAEAGRVSRGLAHGDDGRHAGAVGVVERTAERGAGRELFGVGEGRDGGDGVGCNVGLESRPGCGGMTRAVQLTHGECVGERSSRQVVCVVVSCDGLGSE
jgi:hypothetical protein